MSRRKRKKPTPETPSEPEEGLWARVQAEREKLFRALGVVECCRLATASKLEGRDPELMADALNATYELIDDAASGLDAIQLDLDEP